MDFCLSRDETSLPVSDGHKSRLAQTSQSSLSADDFVFQAGVGKCFFECSLDVLGKRLPNRWQAIQLFPKVRRQKLEAIHSQLA